MRSIFGKLRLARHGARAHTVLGRLRRDVRGNTLAIMAAALIPLCGMVGGGMDMARLYMTKTRLQHACDAGALAGRKNMGAGNWGTDDNDEAVKFFEANYGTGAYTSFNLTKTFTENSGKVTGTATATLPMTVMRVLGFTQETLTVTCDAEMKLPNTDVMFVLDTTGSMNCVAGDTSCPNGNNNNVPASGSKIDGLKTAVKCFYETLAQLDTNAACNGTPSGGTSSAVQIRFGFMPYSSNVNVGHLLPPAYFANAWTYQTRTRSGTGTDWTQWSAYSLTYPNGSNTCNAAPANTSLRQNRVTQGNYYGYTNVCLYERRDQGPVWSYAPTSVDVSGLKSGASWNTSYSFNRPINNDGSNRTINWDGCIEERTTVRALNYNPIPATANDLNIDMVPAAGTPASLWGPALDQLIFERNVVDDLSQVSAANINTAFNYYNPNTACPTEAKKLQAWPSPTTFATYVDSLVATGNTYHDIGMLWGARFMSPTGIFSSENAVASNGGQIQRHMIFMTDGDASSNPCDYNAYGVPWFDQRQTTDVGSASECGTKRDKLVDQINLRLEGLCEAVKNKGITLWVVSYGGGLYPSTETRLQNCASPADSVAPIHKFEATTPTELQAKFAVIAAAISQLRLTR